MNVAGVRNLFTLIDVLASEAISGVAKWALATTERAVRETVAPCTREAGVGQTTICRKQNFTFVNADLL